MSVYLAIRSPLQKLCTFDCSQFLLLPALVQGAAAIFVCDVATVLFLLPFLSQEYTIICYVALCERYS